MISSRKVSRVFFFPGICGTLFIAVMGLLSYLPGMRVLGSVSGNYIPMAPATAVSFIFLALSLVCITRRSPSKSGIIFSFIAAVIVTLFGGLESLEYFTGTDLTFEDVIVPFAGHLNGVPVGRMSPLTGFGFFLSGFAVMLLVWHSRDTRRFDIFPRAAGWLGGLTFLVGFTASLAYLYGHPLLYGRGITVPIALTSALGLVLLSLAVFGAAGKTVFPLNILTGTSTQCYLLRFILPLSVVSVIAGGLTVLLAEKITGVNPALISALLIVAIAVFSGVLAAWISRFTGGEIDRFKATAEQALKQQEELNAELNQLAKFPGQNPNPVLRLSADGTVLYANESSRTLLLHLKQHGGKILPDNFEISFSDLLASGKVYQQEVDCGESVYTLALTPLSDDGLVNIYGMDITLRKRAEQQLALTMEQLRVSNRDLEQFAYIASHDLQEPLRMIANYVQLIERRYNDKLDQDARDFIHYAVDGAVRMQQLIDSLLEYSRLQSRKKPFDSVDLDAVLKRALHDMERLIVETDARITFGPLPAVRGDELQLGQIFQNLISNALKFRSAARPEVHITAGEFPGYWKISVRDNGIGIDPEHQDKIFKIFKRLHSRADYPGTGIGLAVCKRIIERHGGETGVESEAGKGSTFWFTLPKKEKDRHGCI